MNPDIKIIEADFLELTKRFPEVKNQLTIIALQRINNELESKILDLQVEEITDNKKVKQTKVS
tara:strand:+ start:496 stop:684 length:189 start_codon:yes stop_codon:yes gene_type:complete